jgi:hypothetical protein
MRALLILTLALTTLNVRAQNISAEILVNDLENVNTLSRSKLNSLTVRGVGCDQFEISATCASSVKTEIGYQVKPSPSCTEVYISVIAIEDNKRMMLFKRRFKIVD